MHKEFCSSLCVGHVHRWDWGGCWRRCFCALQRPAPQRVAWPTASAPTSAHDADPTPRTLRALHDLQRLACARVHEE
jgi:hypothetical protein